MKQRTPIVWLLAGLLLLPACEEFTDVVEEDTELVPVTVRASIDERAVEASLTVTGDALEEPVTAQMTISADSAEGVVDVPAGEWSVAVAVMDGDGVMYAEGAVSATIPEDTVVDIELSTITEEVTVEATVPSHVTAASLEATGSAIDTARAEMTIGAGTASATVTLPVGATRSFEVTAFDSASIAVLRGTTTEAVVDGEAPTVSVSLAILEGDQPITGTFGGYTFVLSPGETTAVVGDTLSYTATVLDASGTEVADATVTWASTNPGVATVDSVGQAVATAPGVTSIAVTYAGFGVSALLTISEAL